MDKLIQERYNWNPYRSRVYDRYEKVPAKYEQAGWGMQPPFQKHWADIYRMFPNEELIKKIISNDGNRLHELGHLLTVIHCSISFSLCLCVCVCVCVCMYVLFYPWISLIRVFLRNHKKTKVCEIAYSFYATNTHYKSHPILYKIEKKKTKK